MGHPWANIFILMETRYGVGRGRDVKGLRLSRGGVSTHDYTGTGRMIGTGYSKTRDFINFNSQKRRWKGQLVQHRMYILRINLPHLSGLSWTAIWLSGPCLTKYRERNYCWADGVLRRNKNLPPVETHCYISNHLISTFDTVLCGW